MYRPSSLEIKNVISYKHSLYLFRQGEAIIIVGENLDDSSQKSNGSGKSGFVESLALAFIGTSVRNVRVRELINDDADFAEVELVLTNEATNKDLRIWRKIYANTKPAMCRVWKGEVEVQKSSINEYNDFIFQEIGISKEDFLNFYLMTSENYNPFLKVGDVKKKEIINRFSGADSIDRAFPFIAADVASLTAEKVVLSNNLIAAQSKALAYAEQIESIQASLLPEALEAQRIKKQEEIDSLQKKIADSDENRSVIDRQLKQAEKDLRDYDAVEQIRLLTLQIESAQTQRAALQVQKKEYEQELTLIEEKFRPDYEVIVQKEKGIQQQIKDINTSINEFELFQVELNHQLEGMIECPNCHSHFLLQDEEFSEERTRTVLSEVVNDLKSLTEEVQVLKNTLNVEIPRLYKKYNDEKLKAQQDINDKIQSVLSDSTKLSQSISALTSQQTSIQQRESALKATVWKYSSDLQSVDAQNARLLAQRSICEQEYDEIGSSDRKSEIEAIEQEIIGLFKEQDKWKKQIEAKDNEITATKVWEENFKSFKSHIANQSIANIADYSNLFLQLMNSNLSIEIDGYKTLATGKVKENITTKVLRNGFDAGSYGKCSGGERGRIDFAVILAIQELININCPPNAGLDLLIVDEIMDQLDPTGLESIIMSAQNLSRTIAIISQNEINALKEHTVIMRKENKVTTIINNR